MAKKKTTLARALSDASASAARDCFVANVIGTGIAPTISHAVTKRRLQRLNAVADAVLSYRPKPKSKPARKRQRQRQRARRKREQGSQAS